MKSRARFGFLLAACLLLPAAIAGADPAATPAVITSISLKDGRVLHNVRIMANEGDSIIVHADEGLLKVAKVILPPGIADPVPEAAETAETSSGPEMVMQPFDPNQAPAQDPEAKPVPMMTPPPKGPAVPMPTDSSAVFKGCSIVSFQMKAFQNVLGSTEVVIRNDTDSVVMILPRDILCIASNGARHAGHFIVSDGFPPRMKRREFVPAHGQVDDLVTFTNDEIDISSVQWAQ